VLFEMLTGAPPFFAGTVGETIQRRLTESVPRLSESRPDLPSELDEIFGRALARKPRNRYESVEEFSQALDGLPPPDGQEEEEARAKPAVTRPQSSPGLVKQASTPPSRDLGRRLLVLGGILSLIVIILLELFGGTW
jgi:serine/threonine-protein kinase